MNCSGFRLIIVLALGTLALAAQSTPVRPTTKSTPAQVDALLRSIEDGEVDAVHKALQSGVNVNSKSPYGETPLLAAAQLNDHPEASRQIALLLLRAGANISARDGLGRTPLMVSAFTKNTVVLKTLVRAGALRSAKDSEIDDVLRDTAETGDIEAVRMILPRSTPTSRANALVEAKWDCLERMTALLESAGATLPPGIWTHRPLFADFPVPPQTAAKGAADRIRPSRGSESGDVTERPITYEKFAGRFSLARTGCGSSCESYEVFVPSTGRVLWSDHDERGLEFRRNSRLLIVDPQDSPSTFAYEEEPSAHLPVRYFAFEEQQLKLIYSEPCHVSGTRHICGCRAHASHPLAPSTK